ncbi:MAG: TlpA disulfide reductase family protein [Sediminicola sp.]|tara:strand:+ start:87855 stop:89078 length:1224 start_codon:yes stop_codon:yes gene_type:complete
MKNGIIALLLLFTAIACKDMPKPILEQGIWRGTMRVKDNNELPFTFKLAQMGDGAYHVESYNADEVLKIDEIQVTGDSITIQMPVFEGYIKAAFTPTTMSGHFIIESLDRSVPFHATFGDTERFRVEREADVDVAGIWETEFAPNTLESYMGKGIFTQNKNRVKGTFRTGTGDYRYLDGVVDGDSLKLSTFDGSHVYLFKAKVTDSTLNGTFYSGNHYKVPFVSRRNEVFELPDEDSLTYLREGYDKLSFSFPGTDGEMVSLEDERFKDKVVIVQIMGSWCPNCLDETKFLVEYLEGHKSKDLEIVALSFEYAKTEEGAFGAIARLRDRIGVPYPILLAQYGSSNKALAQEKLPMLNHILSYPTTIYLDKQGNVRKIHTGFNGPATGEKYNEFKKEFDRFIKQLERE